MPTKHAPANTLSKATVMFPSITDNVDKRIGVMKISDVTSVHNALTSSNLCLSFRRLEKSGSLSPASTSVLVDGPVAGLVPSEMWAEAFDEVAGAELVTAAEVVKMTPATVWRFQPISNPESSDSQRSVVLYIKLLRVR